MTEFSYKAFISYSHADEPSARWLHRALEAYRVPKHIVEKYRLQSNRLNPIFRDRDELASSSDLSDSIKDALGNSENMIVICSRDAVASRWVNEEIEQFKKIGKADRVFCLLVDEPDESFPSAALVDFDGDGLATLKETEPLAADARPHADGRHGAKLKLIAGLLNLKLDELVQREAARRQRRLTAILLGAIAGMVLTTSLTFYAFDQRETALLQERIAANARDEAIVERDRAEQARAEVEEVVGFLIDIFEVSDPGESLGATITAKEILDRGSERIDDELSSQPLTKARLLATIGAVYQSLGLYARADVHKQEAYDIRLRELGEEHEDTLDALDALTSLALLQAVFEKMESLATQSLRINRDLHGDEDPRVIGALSDIATARSSMGDYEAAVPYDRQALELARASPEISKADLEIYVRRLAINLDELGDNDEAGALYRESLQLSRELFGEIHPRVAFALDNLAIHHDINGDVEPAETLYRQALSMLREIYGDEHPEVAQTMGNVADFLVYTKGQSGRTASIDLADARTLLTQALASNRKLRPGHPYIGDNLMSLAELEKLAGRYEHAQTLLGQAMTAYSLKLPPRHPQLASAKAKMGEVLLLSNDLEGAERYLLESEAALTDSTADQESKTEVLEHLLKLYQRLDRRGKIKEYEEKLAPLKELG